MFYRTAKERAKWRMYSRKVVVTCRTTIPFETQRLDITSGHLTEFQNVTLLPLFWCWHLIYLHKMMFSVSIESHPLHRLNLLTSPHCSANVNGHQVFSRSSHHYILFCIHWFPLRRDCFKRFHRSSAISLFNQQCWGNLAQLYRWGTGKWRKLLGNIGR